MTASTMGRRWTPISIIAVLLGFLVWWPVGLAVLAYVLWGRKVDEEWKAQTSRLGRKSTGNAAFDEYREATLARLEDEQEAFAEFLERLRRARDKEEFDRFMKERERQPA